MGNVFGKSQPPRVFTPAPVISAPSPTWTPAPQPSQSSFYSTVVRIKESVSNWVYNHPIIAGVIGGAIVAITGGLAIGPAISTVGGALFVAGVSATVAVAPSVYVSHVETAKADAAAKTKDEDKKRKERMDAKEKEIAEAAKTVAELAKKASAAEANAASQRKINDEQGTEIKKLQTTVNQLEVGQTKLEKKVDDIADTQHAPESAQQIQKINPDEVRKIVANSRNHGAAPMPSTQDGARARMFQPAEESSGLDEEKLSRLAVEIENENRKKM